VDACRKVLGSAGREDELMDCCKKNANNYPWFPGATDCQNAVDNCLESTGLPNPGIPGGRFGYPCDNGAGSCAPDCGARGCTR
jgi:hypothetical protein